MKRPLHENQYLATAAFALCTLIGAGILMFFGRGDYLAVLEARRAELEAVTGELREAELKTKTTTESGTTHRVEVEYAYSYGGEPFIGSRLGYGWTKWNSDLGERGAKALIEELEARDPFIVYVDRRDPSRAVLFTDATGIIRIETIFVTVVGMAFLVVGGLSLIHKLVMWRSDHRSATAAS